MTEAPSYANHESLEGPARRLSNCLRPVPRDAALPSIRRRYQNMDWSSQASASHAASPNAATTGCCCSARVTLCRILFLFCRPSVAVLPSVLFMLACGAPARSALTSVLKTTLLCCCKLLLREGGAQQVMGCAEGRTESTERESRHETPQVDVTQEGVLDIERGSSTSVLGVRHRCIQSLLVKLPALTPNIATCRKNDPRPPPVPRPEAGVLREKFLQKLDCSLRLRR